MRLIRNFSHLRQFLLLTTEIQKRLGPLVLLSAAPLDVLLIIHYAVPELFSNVSVKRCDDPFYVFDFALVHDIFQDLLLDLSLSLFRLLYRQCERVLGRRC